ncbi:MAG TPA: hypothetical protein VGQ57_16695 [Polyangiaceae bacterium]|jgi:hypothetical protein|nr:hypothetical protein [Polyangiaceae bacterium]
MKSARASRFWPSILIGGLAVALPGCFKVGDDDSGSAGQAGESSGGKGGSGTGGAGGKGGAGGMSAAGGKGADACAPAGVVCTANDDCCDYRDGMGYCDDGYCAPTCGVGADCASGCCHPIQAGAKVCGPTDRCANACVETGGDCSERLCCSETAGTGFCVADACVDACKHDSDCAVGCCLTVYDKDGKELGSACAPEDQCT